MKTINMKSNILTMKVILMVFSLSLFAFAYSQSLTNIVNQSNKEAISNHKQFEAEENEANVANQSLQINQSGENVMHNKKVLLLNGETKNDAQSLHNNQSEKKVMHNKKELSQNDETKNNSIQSEKKEYLPPSETNKKNSTEKKLKDE